MKTKPLELNIFLQSDTFYLEPIEEKHITTQYISWLNDKEVTQFNSHGIFPNNLIKTKNFIESIQQSQTSIVLAIIDTKTLNHIGNCAIDKIDLINRNADLSIILGDRSSWNKGYATQIFQLLINHAFNKLNLHKVTIGTTSDNIAMQQVCKKLNFSQESTLKEHILRDNVFIDIYTYALINR